VSPFFSRRSHLLLPARALHGTKLALAVTGRLSFLLFWLAYTGGALVILFGSRLQPLRQSGRDLGLAFALAHLVHLALVVWLVLMSVVLSVKTYVIFGLATLCLYTLAILSLGRLQSALGARGWWWLRFLGMNYIALAFASDFLRPPMIGSQRTRLPTCHSPPWSSSGRCCGWRLSRVKPCRQRLPGAWA
jgi:hypothetical protein